MAGLSAQELTQISESLAGGKRPRVMFTEAAGQISGQIGHVVHLDDPSSGEEWILVKFGADTLPFSPADLSIPPRGVGRRVEPVSAPEPSPVPVEPEFKVVREKPVTRQERPVSEPVEAPAVPAPRKPAKTVKAKAPASLVVTLSYAEGEWTVGAVQGSKPLAKPYVIKAAEALQMVSMLDVPGVQEAVQQILSSERAEAQAAADKLRAELAELEAKLAELGGAA